MIEQPKQGAEAIPAQELRASKDIADGNPDTIRLIYQWYKDAIVRRGRNARSEEKFIERYFGEKSGDQFAYGDASRGFILGQKIQGVFVPRHFAPKTMRGAYTLLKELGESQTVPTLLFIVDDLEETIAKMPSWKSTGTTVAMPYQGQSIEKKVVYNSNPVAEEVALKLGNDLFAGEENAG